jgi:hypothetical protein
MSLTAAVVRELVAAGVTGDALVTACERIEAAATPLRSTGAERTARWRERNKKRHSDVTASQVTLTPSPLVPPLSPAPLSPPIIPPTRNDNPREASDQAVSEWNDVASELGLPKVQRLTDIRRKKLRNRLKDCGGIDGWRAAMAKIRGSPLCRGELGDWRADFDFVLQESSFVKLMEGKYDGRKPGTGPKAAQRHSVDDAFDKFDACLDEAERREAAIFSSTG